MVTPTVVLLIGLFLISLSTPVTALSHRYGDTVGRVLSAILINLGFWTTIIVFMIVYTRPGPRLFAPSIATNAVALLLILPGFLLFLWAHLVLGMRSGVPSVKNALAQEGPYAWVRHPIYLGALFALAGLFLFNPTPTLGVLVLITVIWLPIQAWLEERDLRQRLPDYGEYLKRVPMFIPLFRKR